MPFFDRRVRPLPARRCLLHARLSLEELESRLVPYTTSGGLWPHPELVTISFIPDGTLMASGSSGNVYSNLFADFDADWSTATWQAEIIKAAQVWARYTNVNFDIVTDNGTTSGQGSYQQGDSGMGDIRVGGYGFSTDYLGVAYLPPDLNTYSIAGDVTFNTNQTFHIDTTYDVQSVAMHEIGHALGLGHSTTGSAVEYASYNGTKRNLTTDDINGIRAIYGTRSEDAYDATLSNGSFSTATAVTIETVAYTGQLLELDITTLTDEDYYTFTAPVGSSSTLTISVQSAGLSLLRPDVSIYDADENELDWATTDEVFDGSTLTLTINGVSALDQFYVRVAGADATAFGTGSYALTVNLGTGGMPSVSLPNTQVANGSSSGGGSGLPQLPGEGDRWGGYRVEADFYTINDTIPHPPTHRGCGCPLCATSVIRWQNGAASPEGPGTTTLSPTSPPSTAAVPASVFVISTSLRSGWLVGPGPGGSQATVAQVQIQTDMLVSRPGAFPQAGPSLLVFSPGGGQVARQADFTSPHEMESSDHASSPGQDAASAQLGEEPNSPQPPSSSFISAFVGSGRLIGATRVGQQGTDTQGQAQADTPISSLGDSLGAEVALLALFLAQGGGSDAAARPTSRRRAEAFGAAADQDEL